MLGQMVGSYRVTALLGEGGMGRVYVAEHALIGRKAAVKVLLPAFSTQAEIVDRFFNEARALAQLRHPGLVDVFDYGKHIDGSAYLVMELLEGESLAARLRRERALAPGLAIEITRQIALAVGAAHKQRIIHRDLKPDNVILVSDPELTPGLRAKILDFGIAKLADGAAGAVRTRTDHVMGTPAYMSPEQCRGAGLVDERTDIYSLGCILFEMVCGRLPFTNTAPGELIGAHIFQMPPRPRTLRPDIPPELEAIILRAMEKKPDARYARMAQLATALEGMQKSFPPPAKSFASQSTLVEPVHEPIGGDGASSPATTLRGSAAELTRPPRAGRGGRPWIVIGTGLLVLVAGATGAMFVAERRPATAPIDSVQFSDPSMGQRPQPETGEAGSAKPRGALPAATPLELPPTAGDQPASSQPSPASEARPAKIALPAAAAGAKRSKVAPTPKGSGVKRLSKGVPRSRNEPSPDE